LSESKRTLATTFGGSRINGSEAGRPDGMKNGFEIKVMARKGERRGGTEFAKNHTAK